MATLQKIRSKGPLLLIVIGLAMLAFILGDAWKIIRPTQGIQFVGSVDGKNISAMDFQKELEKYTEVIKFANQNSDLSEEQMNSIRDEVWAIMVRNQILNKEAAAIGLTVTDAEVRDVIERGTDPILANTPFNGSDGKFDADILKNFLAFYNELGGTDMSYEEYSYYQNMYNYWLFIESDIKSGLLYNKYSALVKAALVTNPIAAQDSYVNRIKRYDVLVAALPFSSIADADVTVTNADLKKTYAENKEGLYNYTENRDIYFIDYVIEPSQADREALLAEVNEITTQLEEMDADYASFLRRSDSEIPYSEVPRSARNLPDDVAERLDSVNAMGVFGPYYCNDDDTYNTFKVLNTVNGYDSIQFAMIQVIGEGEEFDNRADSILNAVRKGADFAELAASYGQTAAENWMSADTYEPATISGDNALYLNKLNSMKKGEVDVLKISGANLVIKVLDTKTPLKKYDIAIVKRPVEFSEETSNAAYNKLSAFLSQNTTVEDLKQNAEDSDFRLLYYPSFENYSYNISGVSRSHEALRWVFGANEGEVSRIFEVGYANDHLLVVGVDKINKRGYLSLEDASTAISYKTLIDKKSEILKDKLAGLSFDEVKKLDNIIIDTIQYCNFTNGAFVSGLSANEIGVGPSVAKLAKGELTTPIKGENCVYVAEKISDDEMRGEYSLDVEMSRLKTVAVSNIPGSIFEALYYNANVVDERYRIF
jgi:peptidyl-prolyl cis-trans isomerase D